MSSKFIKDHISLKSNRDVREICENFFKIKKLDVNHLNYINVCNDGGVFYLCSNHDWLRHYYQNKYPIIGAFENIELFRNYRYVLWSSLDSGDKILQDSKNIIGVEHGITVINKTKNGCEFFNFGTTKKDLVTVNTFVNNLDILNEFVKFFEEKANNLIYLSQKEKLSLSSDLGKEIQLFYDKPHSKQKENSLDVNNKLYINKDRKNYLSQREVECVEWYLKGKNSSEISIILRISRRTVETHIENVKLKLGCKNLFQLGYYLAMIKFNNYGFIPDLHQ